MKIVKYLMAGMLVMGFTAPAAAQDANYAAMIKPIEAAIKAKAAPKDLAKLIKNYSKEFKKDPKALVELGNTLFMNKEYTEAAHMANLAIARNKHYGDAYILLGDIAAIQDDGGNAAMWFQQAMQLDPKNPQGYMRYSNVYRKVDPAEAEKALQALKVQLPDFPIEAEAAHAFYTGQNYEKAFEYYQKTNQNNLEDYRLTEYVISAYMVGKKAESLQLSQFGKTKYTANATYDRVALWSAEDLQKHEEALSYAQNVISNDTLEKSSRDYLYYGMALKGCGKYDEAVTQYLKSHELNQENFKPYQYIAEAYTAAGDEEKALEWNKKYMDNAKDIKPSDYAKLANIYVAQAKKATDKVTAVRKACDIYEGMATKWPSIKGWAYTHAGLSVTDVALANPEAPDYTALYDLSAEYFKKSIDLLKTSEEPSDRSALLSSYQNIVFYYAGIKQDLELAKPYAEELLKLDPNDSNAKMVLGLDQPAEPTTEETPTE